MENNHTFGQGETFEQTEEYEDESEDLDLTEGLDEAPQAPTQNNKWLPPRSKAPQPVQSQQQQRVVPAQQQKVVQQRPVQQQQVSPEVPQEMKVERKKSPSRHVNLTARTDRKNGVISICANNQEILLASVEDWHNIFALIDEEINNVEAYHAGLQQNKQQQ